jgi:hypothetical protein
VVSFWPPVYNFASSLVNYMEYDSYLHKNVFLCNCLADLRSKSLFNVGVMLLKIIAYRDRKFNKAFFQ